MGNATYANVQSQAIDLRQEPWPMAYLRLEKTTLAALERTSAEGLHGSVDVSSAASCVHNELRPRPRFAARFTILFCPSRNHDHFIDVEYQVTIPILEANTAPLRKMTANTLHSYEAFACCYLISQRFLSSWYPSKLLPAVADRVNYKLLASVLASVVKSSSA